MSALEISQVIAAVGAIGLAVLLLQPIASRLRLPDPLLFLGLGVVLAQWSRVTDAVTADVVQVVGTVALIVILAHELTDLPWTYSLILGAVLAPTDPAAVFSALAGETARIGRIGRVLEGEAGLNDPIAIALAAQFVNVAIHGADASAVDVAGTMVREAVIGVGVGVLLALALTRVL